jgi:hypothetical protein
MTIVRLLAAFAVVVFGVVTTVGSGGGGGENLSGPTGPLSPPPPIEPPWVDINIANAQDVSAKVVQDADQVFEFATTIGGQIFPSLPAAPDLLSSNSKFELFETTLATGEPATDTCALSGTVTVSGDPGNDPVSLSEQDVFDLAFDSCDDGNGYSLNGNFSVTVTQLTGDLRTDVFDLSYELSNVAITVAYRDDTHTTSSGASFFLTWDSLRFPVTVLALTADRLALSTQTDDYVLLRGAHARTVNADISVSTTLAEVSDAQLLANQASLDGYVNYETVVPLRAPEGHAPESGEMSVYTAYETIRITIESSASVRLEIDVDDDSVVDDIQYTTWAALLG